MTPDAHERARGMPLAAADETAACSFPGTAASLTAPPVLRQVRGLTARIDHKDGPDPRRNHHGHW